MGRLTSKGVMEQDELKLTPYLSILKLAFAKKAAGMAVI